MTKKVRPIPAYGCRDKKQFVLNQLALAWKDGKTVGREKILEAAKKDHIPYDPETGTRSFERVGKRRAAPGWKGQRRKSDHGKRVEKTGKNRNDPLNHL